MADNELKENTSSSVIKDGDNTEIYRKMYKNPVLIILSVIVIFFLVKGFLFEPFDIPSQSMEPTIAVNDKILVSKISYRFHDPFRDDIIVFYLPTDPANKIKYTKRIIGLPGETLAIKDNRVYINGKVINETYLSNNITYADYGPIKISNNMYFVMGDNRNNSLDSRKWGLLNGKLIIGKAILTFWPLSSIKAL